MDPSSLGRQRFVAGEVFIGVVVVAGLYFGRQVLIPLALAVLLSFVLNPAVERLHRLGLPEIPSVGVVVVMAFLIVTGTAGAIGLQLTELAGDLPRYQYTLEQKIRSIREAANGGQVFKAVGEFLHSVENEFARPAAKSPDAPAPQAAPDEHPVPVSVIPPAPKPIETIERIAGPMVEPVLALGVVVVFVVFILMQRRDLRDRLIWLTGAKDLRRATVAIDDAASRLSRYFAMQTTINAGFGAVITFGLWLIGIPNPLLWGVLAMLFRFVPYIGTMIATALPIGLAAAVDPGWAKVGWTVVLFGFLEFGVSQAIEPLIYGRTTGLSPISVMVSATFWTWLWGPIGLLLSTPLTLLVVVLGQHVDRLSFLVVLLGDEPALTRAESFFQRVMTGDADEVAEQAERFLRDAPLVQYYDEVALPGLRLAQIEANSGKIDRAALATMAATVDEVIENFAEHDDGPGAQKTEAVGPAAPEWRRSNPVLCIAGRSPLDSAIAHMLSQLLEKRGIGVKIASSADFSASRILSHDMEDVRLICLSYLTVDIVPSHPKFLVRRLRRRLPDTQILAGFWTYEGEDASVAANASGVDEIATSLTQAVDMCVRRARGPSTPGKVPAEAIAGPA